MDGKILILKLFLMVTLVSQTTRIALEKTVSQRIVSTSLDIPIFQKGMSYVSWPPRFDSTESDESLRLLRLTNTEWVAICFFWYQETINSAKIRPLYNSPSEESLIHVINKAHELGMRVMLKPMVDPLDGHWRGEIPASEAWFESYADFINHWADFSERHGVELLCIGCEFNANDRDDGNWRKIVAGVREHYSGPITYAANHDNYQNVKWWDSLDYVGIDAYFPLTNTNNPTLDELKQAWRKHADDIEKWVSTVGKPVIFTEIGYRSGDGTNTMPWEWSINMGVDLKEQADCYEAAFQVLWNKSWFYGFYWWNWETSPFVAAMSNSYTPQNKPVEDIVRKWYAREPHAPIFLSLGRRTYSIVERVILRIMARPNYSKTLTVHYVVTTGNRLIKSDDARVQVPQSGICELPVGNYEIGYYTINVTIIDPATYRTLCEASMEFTVKLELPVIPLVIMVISVVTILIVLKIVRKRFRLNRDKP
ncbi:MAG: hypothetical protein QW797_06995, partial [Thermoproteota archaeon]